jgi:hypothetical protein
MLLNWVWARLNCKDKEKNFNLALQVSLVFILDFNKIEIGRMGEVVQMYM